MEGKLLSFARDDTQRRWGLWLVIWFLALHLPFVGLHPLWNRDDSRRAEVAREMLELKEYVVPHLYYVPYLEKPVLNTYFIASSLWLFGHGEFGARFWLAITAVINILLTYALARQMYSPRQAFWAAALFGLSLESLFLARFLNIDTFLLMWILGACYCFHRYFWDRDEQGEWHYSPFWPRLAAILLGLSVLTKGLVGLVVVGLPLVVYYLYVFDRRRWKPLTHFPWFTFTLLFALVVLPWHIAIYQRQPEFLKYFYFRGNIQAFYKKGIHHAKPVYTTLLYLLAAFFPWTLFGILALVRQKKTLFDKDSPQTLFTFWLGVNFLFFSVAISKSFFYVFPLLPFWAILTVSLLEQPMSRMERWSTVALSVLLPLVTFIGLIVAYWVIPQKNVPVDNLLFKAGGKGVVLLGFCAFWTIRAIRREEHWPGVFYSFAFLFTLFWVVASLALPAVSGIRSSKYAVTELKKILEPEDELYIYHHRDFSALFYLERRIPHIGALGRAIELGMRLKPDPKYFLPYSVVPQLLKSAKRVFILIPKKDFYTKFVKWHPEAKGLYHLLFVRGNYMVLSNRPLSAEEKKIIGPFYSSSMPKR